MKTNALALQTKVDTVIQPKPTKAEIIEAMVAVKIETMDREYAEKKALRDKLTEEIKPQLITWALSKEHQLPISVDLGQLERRHNGDTGKYELTGRVSGCDITLKLDKLPAALEKKIKTILALPEYYRKPDPFALRKQIRNAMTGMGSPKERIQALINSPESKKALRGMLKHIGL